MTTFKGSRGVFHQGEAARALG